MKKTLLVCMCCSPGLVWAASNLRPVEQWKPGQTCWVDNTDYVMFHCNCLNSMSSNTRAMFNQNMDAPISDAKCISASNLESGGNFDSKCVVGVAKQNFAYSSCRGTGACDELSPHTVAYICAHKDREARDVCDCADLNSGYVLQSDGITYRGTKTAVYYSMQMSSRCCDSYQDPETGDEYSDCNDGVDMPTNVSKYTVGFCPMQTSVSYACVNNYYVSSRKCVPCPGVTDVNGNTIAGYSHDKSQVITDCYIKSSDTIKNGVGLLSDETGMYGFTADCNYNTGE